MSSLCPSITHWADSQPQHEALVLGSIRLNYQQLSQRLEHYYHTLSQIGIHAGSRVLIALPNSIEFVLLTLAVRQLQAVIVPLEPKRQLTLSQLTEIDPSALFCQPSYSQKQQSPLQQSQAHASPISPESTLTAFVWPQADTTASPDDLRALLYTSGTTGTPKGVMLSQSQLDAIQTAGQEITPLQPSDKVGIITPLFHLYALREIDTCLSAGATLVLIAPSVFPGQSLGTMTQEGITHLAAVPSALKIFSDDRFAAQLQELGHSLRSLCLGTAPTPNALRQKLLALLPHTRILLTYGLTEDSRVCYGDLRSLPAGAIGKAYQGTQLTIRDSQDKILPPGQNGRVYLRSPRIMDGYWKQTQQSQATLHADGSLITPDYGHLDEEGYLYISSRVDDVINSGGKKVSLVEVEDFLNQHPLIAEAAVVARPDPLGIVDQQLHAYVQPHQHDPLDTPLILAYCHENLEPHKCPQNIILIHQFPRTALGKIAKNELTSPSHHGTI